MKFGSSGMVAWFSAACAGPLRPTDIWKPIPSVANSVTMPFQPFDSRLFPAGGRGTARRRSRRTASIRISKNGIWKPTKPAPQRHRHLQHDGGRSIEDRQPAPTPAGPRGFRRFGHRLFRSAGWWPTRPAEQPSQRVIPSHPSQRSKAVNTSKTIRPFHQPRQIFRNHGVSPTP